MPRPPGILCRFCDALSQKPALKVPLTAFFFSTGRFSVPTLPRHTVRRGLPHAADTRKDLEMDSCHRGKLGRNGVLSKENSSHRRLIWLLGIQSQFSPMEVMFSESRLLTLRFQTILDF